MSDTFELRLQGMPADLLVEGVEHNDGLFREARLAVLTGTDVTPVAERLDAWRRRLTAQGDDGLSTLLEAMRSGDPGRVFTVPYGAERALVEFGLLLDDADEAAARGDLLTLVRPTRLRRLNWWAITEILRQSIGLAPTPFPD